MCAKSHFLFITLTLINSITIHSQTKEIYTHPSFDSIAKDHRVLAIIPFDVTVELRPKQKEKLQPGELRELEMKEGTAVQNAIHTYFLKRKEQEKFRVEFQDITKTNTLLAKAGWNDDSLGLKTKEEICKLLMVDGVISGTVFTNKPFSDGAAAAIIIFSDGWFTGPTNSGKCTINIHEAGAGTLLWKYDKTLSRHLGSDINSIINAMMRKASRKFPYEHIK
jgi:hypothetical protein